MKRLTIDTPLVMHTTVAAIVLLARSSSASHLYIS
jgi:hypothetical protein